jgi:5-methylcytosine-specific restriction endonuclease McrA
MLGLSQNLTYNIIASLLGNYKPTIKHKTRIPKNIRDAVWIKYHNDSTNGKCYTCNTDINYFKGWHCSHVIAEANGGLVEVENLRPCCKKCNLSMRTKNLYDYIIEKNLTGRGRNHITY